MSGSSPSSPAPSSPSHSSSLPPIPSSLSGPNVAPLVDVGGGDEDYNFDSTQLAPPPTFTAKLWSKTKKDPFVPIGFIATCTALGMGIAAMGRNDSEASQKFMRLRVGAQAFTLAAVVFALASSGKLFPQNKTNPTPTTPTITATPQPPPPQPPLPNPPPPPLRQ